MPPLTLSSPLSPPEAVHRRHQFVRPKSGEALREPGQISLLALAVLKQLQVPSQVLPAGQTGAERAWMRTLVAMPFPGASRR
jgi:hypothetical protein